MVFMHMNINLRLQRIPNAVFLNFWLPKFYNITIGLMYEITVKVPRLLIYIS